MLATRLINHPRTRKTLCYMVPTYAGAVLSLLTFPMVATKLGVQRYGQLDLFLLLGVALNYAFQFGWGSAHNRYYLEPEFDRGDVVKTLLVFRVFVTVLVIVLIFFCQGWLKDWLVAKGSEGTTMVWIVIATFVCTDFAQFFLQRYRMLGHARRYLAMALSKALIRPLLLLPCLFLLPPNPAIVLLCMLSAILVPLLTALALDHKWLEGGRFRWSLLKRFLHFGVPLVPAALAVMALRIADRTMLRSLIGDPQMSLLVLGYYAFALRLVSINNLASGGFNMVWGPYVFRTYKQPEASTHFSHVFSTYLMMLSSLSLFIIVLSYMLVPVFLEQYKAALPVLSILLGTGVTYSMGDYFCVGISLREKTWIRAVGGGISLAINIVLNFLLIPRFGAIGAASATFVGTFSYVAILMICSHVLFPIPYAFFPLCLTSIGLPATSFMQHSKPLVLLWSSLIMAILILLLHKDIRSLYKTFFAIA